MTVTKAMVTTVIFPDRQMPAGVPYRRRGDVIWPKAYSDQERRILIEEIRAELDGRRRGECSVYAWDRPCRSTMVCGPLQVRGVPDTAAWFNSAEDEFPPQGMAAVAEFGYGALSFWDITESGKRIFWLSENDEPFNSPPLIRYDLCGCDLFTCTSVLPLDLFHAVIEEFIMTGLRPTCIDCREIRREDLPQLDPRW